MLPKPVDLRPSLPHQQTLQYLINTFRKDVRTWSPKEAQRSDPTWSRKFRNRSCPFDDEDTLESGWRSNGKAAAPVPPAASDILCPHLQHPIYKT